MKQWAQKQTGFTIVELLIVIVVIAILAAITIVSYNGITAQARYSQQVAALDKIGKAIKYYVAKEGNSLGSSGTGWLGQGYGSFMATSTEATNYTATSVNQLLRNGGYLNGAITPLDQHQILLTPCTTVDDPRWVVLATVSPAPAKPVAEQISDTGCTNGLLQTYTGGSYNRNFLKVY